MSSDTNKKRSRILAVQKKNLVSLVQNFFIRTVGHHSNINFEEINSSNWEVFASILNSMGPHKSANQWKNTLYYMKNRIRKKVALIRECGGSLYDNLSDLDVKIYEMLPTGDFGVAYDFDDLAKDENFQEENDFTATTTSGNRFCSDTLHEQNGGTSNELSGEQTTLQIDFELTDNVESGHTLTVETVEELESFTQNAVIDEDYCPESTSQRSTFNDIPDHVEQSEQTQFLRPLSPPVQHTTFMDNRPSTFRLHSTQRSTSMYCALSTEHSPFIDRGEATEHPAFDDRPTPVDPPLEQNSPFIDHSSSPQPNHSTDLPVATNRSFTMVRPPSVDPLVQHSAFLHRPSSPHPILHIDCPFTEVRPPSIDPSSAQQSPFLDHLSTPQPNLRTDRPASTNHSFTIVRPPSVHPPLAQHSPFLDRPSTPQPNLRTDRPASTNRSFTIVRPPSVHPPLAQLSPFLDRPSTPQPNLRTDRPVSTNRSFTVGTPSIDPLVHHSPFLDRSLSIDRPPPVNTQNEREGSIQSTSVKTNVRIPEIQKERLVQLVQGNFLKAVGRFAGSNGAAIKANVWQTFAKELNTLGPPRSAEQWKTTFNTIKSSAKAKLADAHNSTNGSVGKALTRLEEKIISIYGLDSMDGQQTLGESGFKYNKTIPLTRHVESGASNRLCEANEDTPDDDVNESVTNDEIVLEDIVQEIRDDDADEEQETQFPPASSSRNANSYSTVTDAASRGTGAASRGTGEESRETGSASRATGSASRETGAESRETGAESRETGSALRETGLSSRGTGSASRGTGSASRGTGSTSRGTGSTSRGTGSTSRGTGSASRGTGSASRGTGAARRGTGAASRGTGRRFFAPPLRNRRNASSDEADFVTDINQFFNDGDEDEYDRRSIHNDRENRGVGRPQRDRSNLRNQHTSYEMVQHSLSMQDTFISDANRNHSEMMHLTDRNHVEMIGIYNSTLRALVNVARDYLNHSSGNSRN